MDSRAVVARFQQERQALALMQHDGIAKVYDCGTSERGQPYFVMELVSGVPLTEFCDRCRLTVEQRIRLVQQVCSAVTHAHQKGIVHRDLKPSNVLVCEDQGSVQIKIIDFGLAKAMGQALVDSMLTEAGQVVGTPEYMAPEQADPGNTDVDTRADVYSLGVMLYELLTGQLPFASPDLRRAGLLEMQRVLRETEPAKPSTRLDANAQSATEAAHNRRTSLLGLRRVLRNDLDWLVLKALEKDRARRYDTANALATDLQRYLDHDPLVAGPPSATYRLRKLVRRYRGQVVAASVVFATLAGGGVATFVQYRRAETEAAANAQLARAAEAARDEAASSAAAAERLHQQARRESLQSRIAAAQQALRIGDAGLAQRMLERCDADLRGFEWRLLARQADESLLRFAAHPGGVLDVATSPDGRRIATIPGRSSPTMGIGIAREACVLRVWDASTGAPVAAVQLERPATTLAFSADGECLWTGSRGQLQRVSTKTWSIDTEVACEAGRSQPLYLADRTGELAFAGTLWRCSPGSPPQPAAEGGAKTIAIDPTGTRVVSHRETSSETLVVHDRSDPPRELATVELGNSAADLAFSRDGKWLLIVDMGWEVARVALDGAAVTKFVAPMTEDPVHWLMSGIPCCAISEGGAAWAIGLPSGALYVWSQGGGRQTKLLGHTEAINALAFLPNGDLVSGATDGTVRVWSAARWRRIGKVRSSDFRWSLSRNAGSAFYVDGTTLTEWSVRSSAQPKPIPLPDNWAPALFGDRLGLILLRNDAGHYQLWDSDSSRFVDGSAALVLPGASLLSLTGEQPLVISIQDRSAVVVLDAATGRQIVRVDSGLYPVRAACLTEDGGSLIVGGGPPADAAAATTEHRIRVFDIATGNATRDLVGHRSTVTGLAAAANIVASASLDGTTKVWSPATGELLADLHGHRDRVYDVLFVDDGERLLSAGQDGTIRVWDWHRGEETSSLRDCPGWVTQIKVDGAEHSLWAVVMEHGAWPQLYGWDCSPR